MMDGSMNANHPGPPGGATPSPPGGNHTQPPGAAIVDHRKFDVEYQTQTLNAYIYDYLRKQNLNQTATSLLNEGSFPANPVVIENRDGGLLEWWLSLFWDAYLQRLLQKPDGTVQGGAAGGPGAGTGLAPGGAAVGAPAAAEPKARAAMRPATVSEPKGKIDANAAAHVPAVPSSGVPPPPYVPPPYKTVGRPAPSPQSMYIVSGWPNPFAAPTGFPPPSSPDVSSVPSPAGAGLPPRSPQAAVDGVEDEAKKRGKGRRRSGVAEGPGAAAASTATPANGATQASASAATAGALGAAQRGGEQNAAQLPYANVPYRNLDGTPAVITQPGKPPLFYTHTVGYPPPTRTPVAMAKGGPALFFPGVNYAAAPPPPRPYAPVPPQAPPHAQPVYPQMPRGPFLDSTRGHWKADESTKRKAPEEPPLPTGAPAAQQRAEAAATAPAAGQPPAGVVPAAAARTSRMWPYAFVGNAPTQIPPYATAVPPSAAYASPYAAPQWTSMEPSVGAPAPPDDPALVYPPASQPLAASTSTEFYSTLGTFFEDESPSQLGGAAVGAGGAAAGGGEAEGGLSSSVGGNVDTDAFLAAGEDNNS